MLISCTNGNVYQYNYLTKNLVATGLFGDDQDRITVSRTAQNIALRNNERKTFYLVTPVPEQTEGFLPIQLSTAVGYTLMVGSWKSTTKGVLPFICMLEDFWYYKFHR